MAHAWHHFLAPLKPGVRVILAILAVMYGALLVGRFTHSYYLYSWLALNPPAFWHGRVWEILTYALLPATFLDFLINSWMVVWLGVWLERVWTQRELWVYCMISALGASLDED